MSSRRNEFSPPPPQARSNLTPEEIGERIAYLKGLARAGADKVHATGTPLEKRHKETPAEELARVRARADKDIR